MSPPDRDGHRFRPDGFCTRPGCYAHARDRDDPVEASFCPDRHWNGALALPPDKWASYREEQEERRKQAARLLGHLAYRWLVKTGRE